MSPLEWRAGIGLSAIYALRMLGLFLLLPVFALYAGTLSGGDNLFWVGLALGAFGATQAVLQIPLGMLSDRIGRKPVIVAGLLVFAAGCVMAVYADDVVMLTVARVIQGTGAISAAVTALAADLTREQHRTKVMAMIGSSIAVTFALSMVIAPVLYSMIGMDGIFWMTAGLSLAAIVLVTKGIPPEPVVHRPAEPTPFVEVLKHPQLLRLNFGVFALHAMQTALWVVVPTALLHTAGLPSAEQWKVYLPATLIAFVMMIPAIIAAERHGYMKPLFVASIALLCVVQVGMALFDQNVWSIGLWLTLFFISFNILEATQPSLISRIAPADIKGAAMGLYNTIQSVGLFVGGIIGGALAQWGGPVALHAASAVLVLFWLVLAMTMTVPAIRKTAH